MTGENTRAGDQVYKYKGLVRGISAVGHFREKPRWEELARRVSWWEAAERCCGIVQGCATRTQCRLRSPIRGKVGRKECNFRARFGIQEKIIRHSKEGTYARYVLVEGIIGNQAEKGRERGKPIACTEWT